MATKKRGLGKGLGELLGGDFMVNAPVPAKGKNKKKTNNVVETKRVKSATSDVDTAQDALHYIKIDKIEPGSYQPRTSFTEESLKQLSLSIESQGVIQPIVVRKTSNKNFEIIAGERRWRASKLAGLTEIPAIVKELSDNDALAIALIENIQREDLNIIEQAKALRRLSEELDLTHHQLAEMVGYSRSNVTNIMRLLMLQPKVQELLEDGSLEMGHGRALVGLKGSKQLTIAQQIVDSHLSVRQAEEVINKVLAQQEMSVDFSKLDDKQEVDPNILSLEQELSLKLGASVTVKHQGSGKGRIVIQYGSLDELDGILAHVK